MIGQNWISKAFPVGLWIDKLSIPGSIECSLASNLNHHRQGYPLFISTHQSLVHSWVWVV